MILKTLRESKGLSQREVSRAIGCSEVVYNRYETGAREPSVEMIVRLADYFGVTTDALLGHIGGSTILLNEYEASLVVASGNADQRAREDALAMLLAHNTKGKKENLA